MPPLLLDVRNMASAIYVARLKYDETKDRFTFVLSARFSSFPSIVSTFTKSLFVGDDIQGTAFRQTPG